MTIESEQWLRSFAPALLAITTWDISPYRKSPKAHRGSPCSGRLLLIIRASSSLSNGALVTWLCAATPVDKHLELKNARAMMSGHVIQSRRTLPPPRCIMTALSLSFAGMPIIGCACLETGNKIKIEPPCVDLMGMQDAKDSMARKPASTGMVLGLVSRLYGVTQRGSTDLLDRTSPTMPIR